MSQQRLFKLIITFLSIIAIISFLSSPFFQLRLIEINGIKYQAEDEINNLLDGYHSKNIWLIDKEEIERMILRIPYIKGIKIEKRLPATLTVNVDERIPLGRIINNGKYLVFDKDGIVLEKGSSNTRARVPEIEGVAYAFSGENITFPALFSRIVQALDRVEVETLNKINKINYHEGEDILTLTVLHNLRVSLGKSEQLMDKFIILESVLNKIEDEKLKVDYIDLRLAQKPVLKLKK